MDRIRERLQDKDYTTLGGIRSAIMKQKFRLRVKEIKALQSGERQSDEVIEERIKKHVLLCSLLLKIDSIVWEPPTPEEARVNRNREMMFNPEKWVLGKNWIPGEMHKVLPIQEALARRIA